MRARTAIRSTVTNSQSCIPDKKFWTVSVYLFLDCTSFPTRCKVESGQAIRPRRAAVRSPSHRRVARLRNPIAGQGFPSRSASRPRREFRRFFRSFPSRIPGSSPSVRRRPGRSVLRTPTSNRRNERRKAASGIPIRIEERSIRIARQLTFRRASEQRFP